MQQLQDELTNCGIDCTVDGRPKHLHSIFKKMVARHIEFEQVYDVIAFRVLVDSVSHCYEVLGHVHSLWHPIPGRFKDYIAMPKPNQYQSLHTSVIGPKGERIEIQIRTTEMHRIAEEGIAAHWQYKEKVGDKNKQQFAWLRQLLEWQQDLKDPNEFLDTVKYDLIHRRSIRIHPARRGDFLKRGATPVDFAFAIHSEVGTHCAGAKANGRMVPLRYELKNGDMVEIITNAQQRPSKDWLSFVRTGKAKSKIRAIVQAEERSRSKELGRELLEREMRRYGMSLQKFIKDGALQHVAEESRHRSIDSLFVAWATVARPHNRSSSGSTQGSYPRPSSLPCWGSCCARWRVGPPAASWCKASKTSWCALAAAATPCLAMPSSDFVTRGRGITVHLPNCSRALDADPARRIDVSWDPRGTFSRPVTVRVLTSDRPGILATISHNRSPTMASIYRRPIARSPTPTVLSIRSK